MKRMAGILIVVLIALCGGVQAETLRSIAPRTVEGERIVELFNTGLKAIADSGEYAAIVEQVAVEP